nr:MAG TPA: hypothetical protein [Caudoviricetes sp.]
MAGFKKRKGCLQHPLKGSITQFSCHLPRKKSIFHV